MKLEDFYATTVSFLSNSQVWIILNSCVWIMNYFYMSDCKFWINWWQIFLSCPQLLHWTQECLWKDNRNSGYEADLQIQSQEFLLPLLVPFLVSWFLQPTSTASGRCFFERLLVFLKSLILIKCLRTSSLLRMLSRRKAQRCLCLQTGPGWLFSSSPCRQTDERRRDGGTEDSFGVRADGPQKSPPGLQDWKYLRDIYQREPERGWPRRTDGPRWWR